MSRRNKRKGKPKKNKRRATGASRSEWVGGVVETPFAIEDEDGGDEIYPVLALWLELPEGQIVGQKLADPRQAEGIAGSSLLGALAAHRRKPKKIRVATQALAAEVREAIGPGTAIMVAPTPEIDLVIAEMAASMGTRPTTLFTSPEITPELLECFFAAARLLWLAAPWEVAGDMDLIGLDLPDLEIEDACVSIMGGAGMEYGIAIYESLEHFETFIAVGSQASDPDEGIDLGGEELLLAFEPEDAVPPAIVAQAKEHGLITAGPRAFPTLSLVRRDASFASPTPEEIEITTAVAAAVASFVIKHRHSFEKGDAPFVRETYELDNAPAVTLTAPFGVSDAFEDEFDGLPTATSATVSGRKVGRNEPCPCGSGKKYKRCCLDAAGPRAEPARSSVHDFEEGLIRQMMPFGFERFGREVFEDAADLFDLSGPSLGMPWMLYIHDFDGATLAEHFTKEGRLSKRERAFLEAQRASWLSVWEVKDVEVGRSLTLVDLLTGEEREVHEVSASRNAIKRLTLLARVVDVEGECVINGMHMRSLPPREGAAVVERARKRLRRKTAVPVARMQNEKIARYLLDRWDEAVEEQELRAAVPPKLVNTEGHELVLVRDRFSYEAQAHDGLVERLERIEMAHVERLSSKHAEVTFHMKGNPKIESWDNTIIGRAELKDGVMNLETNSRERADSLRTRVMKVAGDMLRERGRSFADPMSEPNLAAGPHDASTDGEPPPEALAALAELKARHFATWPDQPVPALNGDTPREHLRRRGGKAAVELLLKDMEFLEQSDPRTAYDVDRLREELGLSRR